MAYIGPIRSFFEQKNCREPAWICLYSLEAVGILMVVAYLFYDRIWAAVFLSPYIFLYVRNRRRKKRAKEKELLANSFREGMQCISTSLAAGYSLENAMTEAIGELELLYGVHNPAAGGFRRIMHQVSLNRPIEDAFCEYAAGQEVEEIRYFAQILSYAKRSGGNLIQIIRNTADMLNERLEVQQEIYTLTTAKRFEQNIMNAVPLGIIAYMRFSDFALMDSLYGNLLGAAVMTVCLVLYYLSVRLAERLTAIEV